MIRVVYRWQIEPEKFEEFRKEWKSATNRIHKEVEGALGSFMLRSFDNEDEVLTIAKWESLKSWKSFWGNADPIEMKAMGTLGVRISVEAFNEIEDRTC